jgi:hypothetical protein
VGPEGMVWWETERGEYLHKVLAETRQAAFVPKP